MYTHVDNLSMTGIHVDGRPDAFNPPMDARDDHARPIVAGSRGRTRIFWSSFSLLARVKTMSSILFQFQKPLSVKLNERIRRKREIRGERQELKKCGGRKKKERKKTV